MAPRFSHCVFCALTLAVANPVAAQTEAGAPARTILFVPVDFGAETSVTPLVAAHMADIDTKARIWAVERHLVSVDRADAFPQSINLTPDRDAVARVVSDVDAAEKTFFAAGEGEAIPKLEAIVTGADDVMQHIAADPNGASALLKAHLLLWESRNRVGETAALPALMERAAGRFPVAKVDTASVAPEVADAFNAARENQRGMGTTVTVLLQSGGHEDCAILVNGFAVGDARTAAVAVRPGSTYYVAAHCKGVTVPPRRVAVAERSVEVRLDTAIAGRIHTSSVGYTLHVPEGPEDRATLTRLAASVGAQLGVDHVVLVGKFAPDDGSTTVLQFDRVEVADSGRLCSTRLPMGPGLRPRELDEEIEQSVRAMLYNRRPRTAVLFAGNDHVYRSSDQHAAFVLEQGFPRPWTWSTAGVGVLAAGTALVFDFLAGSSQNDLEDCIASTGCRGSQRTEELRGDVDNFILARDSLYVTGGVLLVGAVVLFFVEKPDPLEDEDEFLLGTPAVVPWFTPESAGAGLEVTW